MRVYTYVNVPISIYMVHVYLSLCRIFMKPLQFLNGLTHFCFERSRKKKYIYLVIPFIIYFSLLNAHNRKNAQSIV